MTDALGTAASIIAVLQLSAQVASLSYDYIKGVKRAPEERVELSDEFKSITTVLTNLEVFQRENPSLATSWELDGPLKKYTEIMMDLKAKLEPRKTFLGVLVARMQWPLNEKETRGYIFQMEGLKTLFLLAMGSDQTSRLKTVEGCVERVDTTTQSIKASVQDIRADQISRRKEEDKLRMAEKRLLILDWLYSESFERRHIEISDRRQENTGQWILSAPEIQEWKGSPQEPLIWGYGIPGAGKTFLSSLMIDDLLRQAPVKGYAVAYIYFNYSEQLQQRPRDILSSLVKQLARQVHPDIPKEIEDLYDKIKSLNRRPTLEEMYLSLSGILRSGVFAQTFIICDALDECEPEQRATILPMFHLMGNDGAKLFLTSREHPEDIQESFQNSLMIRLWAKDEDIARYIEQKIKGNIRAKRLIGKSGCKDKIISELTECSKGMFLLVSFHIKHVCQQTTARQVLVELGKIKGLSNENKPLDPTYDRALQTIRGQAQNCVDLATKVFTWLLKARRILTIRELQLAVAMEKGQTIFDEDNLPDKNTIIDVCASLVTFHKKSGTVRLVHYTAQEYLQNTKIVSPYSDIGPTISCATFISLDIFASPCDSNDTLDSRYALYPFLKYAVKYLPYHLSINIYGKDNTLLSNFYGSPGNISSYMQALETLRLGSFYGADWPTRYDEYAKDVTLLHIAVLLQELNFASYLLNNGADLEAVDSFGRTALSYANTKDIHMVCMLLRRGADLSAVNLDGQTAVLWAISYGETYTPPLSRVTNTLPKTTDQMKNDEYEIMIRRLLEKGADFSSAGRSGRTAMHEAAYHGYLPVVKLLIEKGFSFSDMCNVGSTPIYEAALMGHIAVVKLLLEKGVDPSPIDNSGETPMHVASRNGRDSIVQLLLENGADPSIIDNEGKTASHYAELRRRYWAEQQERYANDDLS